MTVFTSDNKQFFTPNGVTTQFFFSYRVLVASHIRVYLDEELVDPGDYTVSIDTDGVGGYIQFSVAPTGTQGLIYRYVNYTQEAQLPNESDFQQRTVEDSLDKLTIECQQLQEQLNRALLGSLFDESGLTFLLPPPDSRRALLWHPDEDGRLINSTYDPDELFNSTQELLELMATYLAEAEAARDAAQAAQAAAETARDEAQEASGTGSFQETYFPTFGDASPTFVGDMLVWSEITPGVFGYDKLHPGDEEDILSIQSGFPTWVAGGEGPTGPTGPEGATGPTGPTGPSGPAAASAIKAYGYVNSGGAIAFSSGVVSVTKPLTGRYIITLSPGDYASAEIILVTVVGGISNPRKIASGDKSGGPNAFTVAIMDADSATYSDEYFQFAII